MAGRRWVRALVLLGGLGACVRPEPDPEPACWSTLDEAAVAAPERLSWTVVGEPAVGAEGIAAPISLALSAGLRTVALRVSDPTGGAVCTQLQSVRDVAADAWVTPPSVLADYGAYCRTCPQRVSVGVGAGLYVLPSGDPLPPAATTLEVTAAARDCATFLPLMSGATAPARLRVEALLRREIEEARAGEVRLEIAISPGSSLYAEAEPLPTILRDALADVNTLFAPGKLSVNAVRGRRVDGVADPLVIERGDHSALARLESQLHACDPDGAAPDDTWIPLVLGGCLQVKDTALGGTQEPDGFVPQIPSGMPAPGRARGIFLRGRGCDASSTPLPWTREALAKLIAHELGHALGLYHSVEGDGSADALDDTGAENVMNAKPFSVAGVGFSAAQLRVMRRHPSVHWR